MLKTPDLKRYCEKFKNFIKESWIYILIFLPIFLSTLFFLLYFVFKEDVYFYILAVGVCLYLCIIIEIISFRIFKEHSDLENLESKIDKEVELHPFLFIYLPIIIILVYMEINLIIFLFITFLMGYLIAMSYKFFSSKLHFSSYFNLKRKLELSVYISLEEGIILLCLANFFEFLNESWPHLTLYLSIQSFEYLNIVKSLFVGGIILIIAIINIQINKWRINRRFEHIANLKTKNLKNERNQIIKVIKNISDSALKNKLDEKQWRRSETLKTRLSFIESEINEISKEYTSKPEYLSRVPILITAIYILFQLFMKFFEFLGLL